MNLRQGVLVTSFCTTLFLNFASTYWTMWSVATMSLFVIMITDFMFFEVIDCCCFHPAERLAPRVRSARHACRSPHCDLTHRAHSSPKIRRTTSSGRELLASRRQFLVAGER